MVGEGGEVRGGERGDMKQITAHSNPYSSSSLSFCLLCIRRGFDKNFARGRAEHVSTYHIDIFSGQGATKKRSMGEMY